MDHGKTAFHTEIFAGAKMSAIQCLAPLRYNVEKIALCFFPASSCSTEPYVHAISFEGLFFKLNLCFGAEKLAGSVFHPMCRRVQPQRTI
jgi:hypothetical protein